MKLVSRLVIASSEKDQGFPPSNPQLSDRIRNSGLEFKWEKNCKVVVASWKY